MSNRITNDVEARWVTQSGGEVVDRTGRGDYRFVVAPPNQTALKVGDRMPAEWGIAPINRVATELDAGCPGCGGKFGCWCE